jgi:hypothetical protein
MDFKIKTTKLTDGSKVFDVDVFSNGDDAPWSDIAGRKMCIFSCTSEKDALAFFAGLEKLVEKHTLETLNEV